MQCYQHSNTQAVVICKGCGKSLCHDCVIKDDNILACSAVCHKELKEAKELHLYASKVSGIGAYKGNKRSNADWLAFFLPGIFFILFANYQVIINHDHRDTAYYFLSLFGLIFVINGFLYWRRAKKLGLRA